MLLVGGLVWAPLGWLVAGPTAGIVVAVGWAVGYFFYEYQHAAAHLRAPRNRYEVFVRRHHFRGGAATHGSMFHRAPGSIGASSYPSRVVKGMRAAGRMGGDRVTTRNLKVVQIDAENNLLVIRGAVPGAPGGYVVIRKAVAAKPEPQPQAEKPSKGAKAVKAKK